MKPDMSQQYFVEPQGAKHLCVEISERYMNEGNTIVEIEVSTGDFYSDSVQLDNPDQVRELRDALDRYLKNRGTFRALTDDDPEIKPVVAAEPEAEYGMNTESIL